MTRITPLTLGLCAAITLTVGASYAQTLRIAPSDEPERRIVAPSNGDDRRAARGGSYLDTICGTDLWMVWWEEDENGQEIPGSYQFECLDEDDT